MRTHPLLASTLRPAGLVVLCALLSPAPARAVGYEVIWTDSNSASFTGGGLQSSYFGDIDGDGVQEIVVSLGGTGTFRILDGMTGAEEFQIGFVGNATMIAMVDLNADGTPEVLVQTTSVLAAIDFAGGVAVPPPAGSAPPRRRLHGPEPNPFNPSTRIAFEIDAAGRAEVVIHDVQGRVVRRLAAARLEAGRHELVWDGRNENGEALASGTYFYNLRVDGRVVDSRKAVVLR